MSTPSHSIQKKHLLGVLDHIYGPYDDFSFFNPKKFPPTGCIPALTDVELYLNKEQIGYDNIFISLYQPESQLDNLCISLSIIN